MSAAAPARPRITVIVCAFNEERYLGGCLHSVFAQTRTPDQVLVVNNASTDATREVAARFARVQVVDEPRRGLVRARETGREHATGDLLVYFDADSRPPLLWLEHAEQAFLRQPDLAGASGPFRYYDWDAMGRLMVRIYDVLIAPPTHFIVQRLLRVGAVLYGAGFAVRRTALDAIGGFDTSIEFHGEDTNLGRRLAAVGDVLLSSRLAIWTSARRYHALGRGVTFNLYIRNFLSETFRHRPSDRQHVDVRA